MTANTFIRLIISSDEQWQNWSCLGWIPQKGSPWYNRTGWLGVKHQLNNSQKGRRHTPSIGLRYILPSFLWRKVPESDAGSVGSACHKITTCIGDPFVYLFVAQRQPIRIDYKVLQLLQSGRAYFWPDWIILDAHRPSKISRSSTPFFEKEVLASGWPLSLLYIL